MKISEEFRIKIDGIMSGEKPLSYSALSKFIETPRHYYDYATKEFKHTPAMEFGKMLHMFILQNYVFKEKYYLLDDLNIVEEIGGAKPRATKKYKEWLVEQTEKANGKEIISFDELEKLDNYREALLIDNGSKDLIKNIKAAEQEFNFEHDGFKIRGFIDAESSFENNDCIFDLKTISSATAKKIRYEIYDRNYDLQAGVYCNAIGCKNYFLLFIDGNFAIQVVKLSEETINAGFEKFEKALQDFQTCAETDSWLQSYSFYNRGYLIY